MTANLSDFWRRKKIIKHRKQNQIQRNTNLQDELPDLQISNVLDFSDGSDDDGNEELSANMKTILSTCTLLRNMIDLEFLDFDHERYAFTHIVQKKFINRFAL